MTDFYQQRQIAKKENYERKASEAETRSTEYFKQYSRQSDFLTQPLLSDHHSFKPAQSRRKKIIALADKGLEQHNKAKHYRHKLANEGNAIASDNPTAVDMLQAKLTHLQAKQKEMKEINRTVKKHKDADPQTRLDALKEYGLTNSEIVELLKPDFAGRMGYPSYELTNNSASMRRVKKRIEELENHDLYADISETGKGWNLEANEGRLVLEFDEKPESETLGHVKRCGYKWAPSRKAWVRKDTPNARKAISELTKPLKPLQQSTS